jgi:hypothetical protein
MATEAQITANRRNSRRSTGPRTAAGKATSSANATSHGLTAERVVIFDELPAEFEAFRDRMLAALAPADVVEELFAARIILCSWRLRRAARIEAALLDDQHREMVEAERPYQGIGTAFCVDQSEISNLSHHESMLERALNRAYLSLERRQARRRGEAVPPPIAVQLDVTHASPLSTAQADDVSSADAAPRANIKSEKRSQFFPQYQSAAFFAPCMNEPPSLGKTHSWPISQASVTRRPPPL